jgi:threonine dehydrogenase-like Zn-dependent dehydrogenase
VLFLSDILPTGYFGADIANVQPGDDVAVFGGACRVFCDDELIFTWS